MYFPPPDLLGCRVRGETVMTGRRVTSRITCARLVRFELTRRPVSPPVDSGDPSQSRKNSPICPYIPPGRRRASPLLARLIFHSALAPGPQEDA